MNNGTMSSSTNNPNDDVEPLLHLQSSQDEESRNLEFEVELPSYDDDDDDDPSSVPRKKQSITSSTSPSKSYTAVNATCTSKYYNKWQIITYMFIFFIMMIGHEVALEAASTSFKELDSLASAVTLFQFGFCFLLPLITSRSDVIRTFPKTYKEILPYIQLSILVFGASGLATQSLKYVSYPTKVVFKSAKLIPTMIVSTFVTRTNKSNYTVLDYLSALLICLGAAGYSYNSGHSSNSDESHTSIYGVTLLSISIVCDAILPNLQQNLMMTHNQNHWLLLPSSLNNQQDKTLYSGAVVAGLSAQAVMVNTNAVGFGSILVYMLLSGSLLDTVSTAMAYPLLLFYLVCVGVGLSIAVLAYTKLIHASGSVVAVAVSTLRKVVTVLLSYILFPKPILSIHMFSGLFVLIGVLIGSFWRKR